MEVGDSLDLGSVWLASVSMVTIHNLRPSLEDHSAFTCWPLNVTADFEDRAGGHCY